MNYSDYHEAVYSDTIEYIEDQSYLGNFADPDPNCTWGWSDFLDMMDEIELCVTGNDNGSYYCNSYKAKQALQDAVFDEDILALLSAHGLEDSFWRYMREGDYESADVIIRCAMFYEIYDDVQEWIIDKTGCEF